MEKFRSCILVCVFCVFLIGNTGAAAGPSTNCNTPFASVESLLGWLQPETYNPELAALCLDPHGRTHEQRVDVAKRVKAVYDAKALYVEVDKLSTEPDWVDPETRKAQFSPHLSLPSVVVARQPDGTWRWTRSSLDTIDVMYDEMFSVLNDDMIESLPSWLRKQVFGIQTWQWLALMGLLLLGLVIRKVVAIVISKRIQQLAERFGQNWASDVISQLSSPLATFIMGVVIWLSYPILRLPVQATVVINLAVRTIIIFSIVWASYRLVDIVAEVLAARAKETETKLDDQLVPLLRKSAKVITAVAGALLILQNLNINVASLLAGLGIGGLAVAFAAKDTLANFFGSVMIFLDHPFQIGDWIVLDGTEGVVEEVGFRSTRIRTFYNSLVCVPNSKFTEGKIDNYGARRYRRVFTTIGLTYDTSPEQMQAFVEGVRAIIKANPYTRRDYYEVHMSGFGEYSLNVMLYFFFELPGWSDELRERHNIFLEVMRLASNLGVEFAFPTRTLHVEQVAQPGASRQQRPRMSQAELADIVRAYGPMGASSRPSGPQIAGGFFAETDASARGSEEDNDS